MYACRYGNEWLLSKLWPEKEKFDNCSGNFLAKAFEFSHFSTNRLYVRARGLLWQRPAAFKTFG